MVAMMLFIKFNWKKLMEPIAEVGEVPDYVEVSYDTDSEDEDGEVDMQDGEEEDQVLVIA